MPSYKFVGEMYFEANDMDHALAELGAHFIKLSKREVSHLPQEGSSCAIGEPGLDAQLANIKIVDMADFIEVTPEQALALNITTDTKEST